MFFDNRCSVQVPVAETCVHEHVCKYNINRVNRYTRARSAWRLTLSKERCSRSVGARIFHLAPTRRRQQIPPVEALGWPQASLSHHQLATSHGHSHNCFTTTFGLLLVLCDCGGSPKTSRARWKYACVNSHVFSYL